MITEVGRNLQVILEKPQMIPDDFTQIVDGRRCIVQIQAVNPMVEMKTRQRIVRIILDKSETPIVCYYQKRTNSYTIKQFLSKYEGLRIALTDLWILRRSLEQLMPLFVPTSTIRAILDTRGLNMEVQRHLILRYGLDKILNDETTKIIHTDPRDEMILFTFNEWASRTTDWQYLKVKDRSSDRVFILRVPKVEHQFCCGSWFEDIDVKVHYYINTCIRAQAWTYWMRDTDYRPVSAT